MHIRTNIELNLAHFVILAICPIVFLTMTTVEGIVFAVVACVAFLISVSVCRLFSKFLDRKLKVFVTAVLSSFIVTMFNYILTKTSFLGLITSDNYYFAALSSVILSLDFYYIDNKDVLKRNIVKSIVIVLTFVFVLFIFTAVKEIFGTGKIFGRQILTFDGQEFFLTPAFSFVFLAVIAAIIQAIYRAINKNIETNRIYYEKFVKDIRNEKIFQYDKLRRQKLLSNTIEIRKISDEEAEKIKEQSNQNETLTDEEQSDETDENTEKKETKKKKHGKKLKVSKEAKVEKLFDRQDKKEED
ncbi:MAG: hypothetical protein IJ538_04690 [Clostridia bacterium]|nr:hypothetical protein [Clostridia bacterium]